MAAATVWVVVADEAIARILELRAPHDPLEEVETLTDAAAHAKEGDLRRDAYGRRAGDDLRTGGNATASAGEDEKHLEARAFARRVAARLAEAQREQRYDALRIAAAPRFLGLLRQALDRHVAARVEREFDLDLTHEAPRALKERLFAG